MVMIIATLVNVMNTFIFHDDNDDDDELAKAWVSSELTLVGPIQSSPVPKRFSEAHFEN